MDLFVEKKKRFQNSLFSGLFRNDFMGEGVKGRLLLRLNLRLVMSASHNRIIRKKKSQVGI